MLDWLAAWGVSSAVGFLFKDAIAPLAKGALEDYVKDFFKDSIRDFTGLLAKDTLQKVAGQALKEFLAIVQQELEVADVPEGELARYISPLSQFIRDDAVKALLGSAFAENERDFDYRSLSKNWHRLNLLSVPDEFRWESVGKLYLKKVKALIRESDELRVILDSQKLESIDQNTRELLGIIPDFDLGRYQEGIREQYGNLRLDSLDTDGAAYDRLKLWSIFIPQNVREVHQIVPKVYELPKEHLRRLRDSHQLEGDLALEELAKYREVYTQQPIRPVLDIINDKGNYRYIVILGDPGAGKSSLLQYLALTWANSPLNNVISLPIPLLIELRTYLRNREERHCKNFLEFFHQSSTVSHLNQHQLHEQLKTGKVLVMFDGLDEVFDPGKREDVITDIHRFTNEYPQVQVIVTSRVIGYKVQRLRDAEFRHFMLEDLDESQINDFIYRWHELTFSNEADKLRKRERLQRAINTSKSIKELAANPLLLTMMAILNRNQELPRDRPELYNQASRVLLQQWDVERALIEDPRLDPNTIDYKDKQAILRLVAYQMQGNTKGLAGNVISATDLERIITDYLKTIEVNEPRTLGRVLINQLRMRNFILCFLGGDYYAFIHRTFLEYFCAWEYVWQFKETQTLSLAQLKEEVFGKHWQDESWHEVLRLIVGMLESRFGGEIIEFLMGEDGESEKFQNIFLAAKCLEEVRNRQFITATDRKLLDVVKSLTTYYIHSSLLELFSLQEIKLIIKIRTQAVAAIAITWQNDPDTLPLLKQWVNSDDPWVNFDDPWGIQEVAVEAIAKGWKNDPDTLPLLKQLIISHDNLAVRDAAVSAIAKGWKDEPDTLPLLKRWVTDNDDWAVRRAALHAIVQGWKNEADTLPLLKQLVTNDDNSFIRRAAVEAIAKGWENHPDTLPLLKQLVTNNDSSVRKVVLHAIAQGWKDDPDTLPLLKERVTNDDDSWVRLVALEAIANSWHDDPDTLSLLKQRVTFDENEDVRCAALTGIVNRWKNHQDTLFLLKEWVTSNQNSDVRSTAVTVIAKKWKDDPDTLPLLKQKVTFDENEDVRCAALEAIAQGWKNDPDTLPLLKERVTNEDNYFVRYVAIEAIAQGWKNDPDIFELLYNVTINDPFQREEDWQDNPRQIALAAIIKNYPNHPQIIPILQDRLANDTDEKLREFAKKQLQKLGY